MSCPIPTYCDQMGVCQARCVRARPTGLFGVRDMLLPPVRPGHTIAHDSGTGQWSVTYPGGMTAHGLTRDQAIQRACFPTARTELRSRIDAEGNIHYDEVPLEAVRREPGC